MNKSPELNHNDTKPKEPKTTSTYEKIGIASVDAANKVYYELTHREETKKLEDIKDPRKSPVDPLTNCYTPECLNRFDEYELNPDEDDGNIVLILIDLNNLKKINDTKGHIAGNVLIKSAANWLKTNFREDDYVIRLGGDEFLIICRNRKNDENFEENLRSKVSQNRLLNSPASFAFGVSTYHKDIDKNKIEENQENIIDEDLEPTLDGIKDIGLRNTLDDADKQMYKDKKEMKLAKINEALKNI